MNPSLGTATGISRVAGSSYAIPQPDWFEWWMLLPLLWVLGPFIPVILSEALVIMLILFVISIKDDLDRILGEGQWGLRDSDPYVSPGEMDLWRKFMFGDDETADGGSPGSQPSTGGESISPGSPDDWPKVDISQLPEHVQDMYRRYSAAGWKGNVSGQAPGTRAGKVWENSSGQLSTIDSSGRVWSLSSIRDWRRSTSDWSRQYR